MHARRTRHDCDRCVALSQADGRAVEHGTGRYRPLCDQFICGPCYPVAVVELAARAARQYESTEDVLEDV